MWTANSSGSSAPFENGPQGPESCGADESRQASVPTDDERGVSFFEGYALNFSAGQVVVHPHHGPATVKKIFTRSIRGELRSYIRLAVPQADLEVSIPVDQAEEIGVRSVVDAAGVREVITVLLDESEDYEKVWARRIKANAERLRTGNLRTVAGLIRDLTRQNEEKRLAFGETKLLRDAMAPFVAELSIVLAMPAEDVEAMVVAAVVEGVRPELPKLELATAS